MKRHSNLFAARHSLFLMLATTSLVLPQPGLAASVALATAPLATSTTSSVLPNVMFQFDDSISMASDYLPDWSSSTDPKLRNNAEYNGVYYNPAVNYKPPVMYNADGTLNTTTYPSQTGMTAATGASSAAKPNWAAVKNDGYGVESTATTSLAGSASYYSFVAGEYCTAADLKNCVTASAPTTVSGVSYSVPATLRWCTTATNASAATPAVGVCQAAHTSGYASARYPKPATATVKVTSSSATNTVSQITVNGQNIMAAAAAGNANTSTMATNIANQINACTAAITGACTVAGYKATVSTATVTITSPCGITSTPGVTGGATTTQTAFTGGSPGCNLLVNIVSTNNSYPYPGTAAKSVNRTDCAGTTCTYAEEMTNYANWWAYYHTRVQAMKTSVSRAFSSLDNRYRVGFTLLGNTGITDSAGFLHVDKFELAHKNAWFTKLFAATTNSGTPTRGSLSKVGRYFAHLIGTAGHDPIQYSCQQNFTIIGTDGTWNASGEVSSTNPSVPPTAASNSSFGPFGLPNSNTATPGVVGDQDNDPNSRPMYQGPTVYANTLADVAKYYYETDLRTSARGNCSGATSTDYPLGNPDVCENNVFVSSTDNNLKQHLTTFTLGLGVDDTLVYSSDYLTATSGDYYNIKKGLGSPTANWPNPNLTNTSPTNVPGRIDDVWHAAVNGRGLYFSASDPNSVVAGFNTALSSITAKLGAAAAAATSTLNPVAGNNYAYVASYTTNVWKGNLESRPINTSTGAVSETANWCVENIPAQSCAAPGTIVTDTSGSSTIYNCVLTGSTATACTSPGVFDTATSECRTEIQRACTGTMPAKVAAASDTRTIYTAPAGSLTPLTGQNLVPFNAAYATANPTNFAAAHINGLNQWGSLVPSQQAAAEGTNLINYLRGQNGFEDRAANLPINRLYRTREAVLGDALESQPAFIGPPVFSYSYAGYSTFKSNQSGRAGTVFMGANDGMMHAFAADTGIERWAYVPSMVIPNLWKLASTSYSNNHVNFVNGSPVTTDICTANCAAGSTTAVWKTILVGGLNGGGRGYYALDITAPDTPVLLWEFTTADDNDLGYSFGVPIVTRKSDGTWVVLVTSGYNNTSPGNGQGYLYVLNAGTGGIISKIATGAGSTTTPSGLAKIAGWNNESGGNTVGYVYGGDLLGNLWRFDINSTTVATIGTGAAMKFAELYSDTTGNSPQPITTTPVLGSIGGKRVIFIGTGKYLESGDLTTTQVQTQYAIKDDNETATLVNPRNSLVHQYLINNPNGTATRLSSGSSSTTAATNINTVNFATGRGWYVDFPDSKERVNIDSKLVQGTLLVPTIVPSNTVCSPGGYGWLNYLDYKTGGAVNTATNLSSAKYDSTIVGVNVIYIEGQPKVGVVTSTNPTPELDPNVAFGTSAAGFSGKRVIWRELIP